MGQQVALVELMGFLRVETFVQRDMDVQALNFPKGVTPFSGEVLPEKKGIALGTGDNFITNAKEQLKGLEIEIVRIFGRY